MDNNIGSDSRRLGAVFLVVGWIIVLGLGGVLVHKAMFSPTAPKLSKVYGGTQLVITRGFDSHYRIDGSINGVAVTFLIDTGATSVAIPQAIAQQAKLKNLAEVTTNTASGTAVGYLTSIDNLKINQIELTSINAIIIPEMQASEVLLGMNVLKKFNIQQTDDQLTLTVPN